MPKPLPCGKLVFLIDVLSEYGSGKAVMLSKFSADLAMNCKKQRKVNMTMAMKVVTLFLSDLVTVHLSFHCNWPVSYHFNMFHSPYDFFPFTSMCY